MLTSQGAAREICEHYYPALARHMLAANAAVIQRQEVNVRFDPDYNVYEDKEYGEDVYNTISYNLFEDNTEYEKGQKKLVIFYGYPEVCDTAFGDYKPPKDSLNRLFILLERYNKAIKRRLDLNMKKILRGIVLKDAPLVECDVEQIPLTE
jgi:hypothetical protein